MMIKTFYLLICLLCLSCSNNDGTDGSNQPLQGTKWKLTGFVDNRTGTLKAAEPASEKCYLLTFKDDNTFEGVSSTNQLLGSYTVDIKISSIHITNIGGTEINELYDGKLFVESLAAIQSFSVAGNNLKLYYDDQKKYLFFKKID